MQLFDNAPRRAKVILRAPRKNGVSVLAGGKCIRVAAMILIIRDRRGIIVLTFCRQANNSQIG
jgi:hypothetical protein